MRNCCPSCRYSNISCELLTSDINQINERLGEDEKLLTKLYGFLQNEPPLNPLLASFFSKVLSILIGRKPERVGWSQLCGVDRQNVGRAAAGFKYLGGCSGTFVVLYAPKLQLKSQKSEISQQELMSIDHETETSWFLNG